MTSQPLKVAVIAGEVSGDLLGADLIACLKEQCEGYVSVVGVGGDALTAQGLRSLFDYSELSIMGISQVLAKLPSLLKRIKQTADFLVNEKPDVLVIIDSPDFTHRVAKRVKSKLPDLPVINYVCPSVWAWKPERAPRMRSYVDHVLALLPFEPEAMRALSGPPTTYVGHRLTSDPALLKAREANASRAPQTDKVCLLLPGSRRSEIDRLLPVFGDVVAQLSQRRPDIHFVLPAVPRQEHRVRELVESWSVKPDIVVGTEEKWKAFTQADAAIAASGTVILELALTGIPVVSVYKVDWLIKLMHMRINIWTAALPNLIADYTIIPEYVNEVVRPGSLLRWVEKLVDSTDQRRTMVNGYRDVWDRMQTERPPGAAAATIVLDYANKKPGHL